MTYTDLIPDDNAYERALERVRAKMNVPFESKEEEEELQALAEAVENYYEMRWGTPDDTDGSHELQFMLDQKITSLDELVPLVGGWSNLIDYMTRKRDFDEPTIDAIAANLNTKREWIDKPFCRPPGWQEIEDIAEAPWAAELLAHRDANADAQDTQDAEGTREPELAAAL